MKKFHIIEVNEEEIHVFILGAGNFADFWSELEREIQALHLCRAAVFIDLCLRHGLSNRFFTTFFHNSELQLNEVRKVEPSFEIQKIYDEFILLHQEVLRYGILAKNRQLRILQILKDKYRNS